jgi:hypothetical protein
MSFLNPLFLFALAAVAIPIAVHFWRIRKPEQLPFSSLIFFQKIKQKAMKRLKLKEYLLLVIRVAAITLLAMILARPFLPPSLTGGVQSSGDYVVLVLDNSPSMDRVDGQGPYLAQAQELAEQVITQSNPDDRFLVWATQGIDDQYSVTQWLNADQARERLQNIHVRAVSFQLNSQWKALAASLQQTPSRVPGQLHWYVFGDGQAWAMDQLSDSFAWIQEQRLVQAHQVQYVRTGEAQLSNLVVEDIRIAGALIATQRPFSVEVTVRNTGAIAAVNQYVSLRHNENIVGQYETDIEPGASRSFGFELVAQKPGIQRLEVELDGDDFPVDNIHRSAIHISNQRKVLYLQDDEVANTSQESFFKTLIEVSQDDQEVLQWHSKKRSSFEPTQLSAYDAVVLDGWKEFPTYIVNSIAQFVQEGGGVLLFPAANMDIQSYNTAFEKWRIGQIQGINGTFGGTQPIASIQTVVAQHPIFEGIFEAEASDGNWVRVAPIPVNYYYRLAAQGQSGGQRTVIQTDTQDPILLDSPLGQGHFMIATVGLNGDWSQLPYHPLFAPLWYQTSVYLASGEVPDIQKESIQPQFTWTGPLEEVQNVSLLVNDISYRPQVEPISGLGRGVRIQANQEDWQPGWITINNPDTSFAIGLNLTLEESIFSEKTLSKLEKRAGNSLHIRNDITAGSLSDREFEETLKKATFGQEIWQWFAIIAVILLIIETIISTWYNPTQAKQS